MRFSIHTVLKITPFELLIHIRSQTKNRSNEGNENRKINVSTWSETFIAADTRPEIPIYDTRKGDGYFQPHQFGPKKKRRRRFSVSNYHFHFLEKNTNKKSVEGRFQKSLQTAKKIRNTLKPPIPEKISPKIHFGSNYMSERKKSSTEERRHNRSEKQSLSQRD